MNHTLCVEIEDGREYQVELNISWGDAEPDVGIMGTYIDDWEMLSIKENRDDVWVDIPKDYGTFASVWDSMEQEIDTGDLLENIEYEDPRADYADIMYDQWRDDQLFHKEIIEEDNEY